MFLYVSMTFVGSCWMYCCAQLWSILPAWTPDAEIGFLLKVPLGKIAWEIRMFKRKTMEHTCTWWLLRRHVRRHTGVSKISGLLSPNQCVYEQ